ncbi:hypothetical protein [Halobaculum sp. MBLA0143]|uniref:hypothetical protein n=1 Tax=Halobaculum sp. MBLA0143 TaxID=3079933 RepID=UPI0035247076
MVTVTDFVVRLLTSAVEMAARIGGQVALKDPLSFVSVLFGTVFVTGAVAVLGYLAVGALFNELGITTPTLGRGQREADGRIPTARPNPEAQREAKGAARAKQDER